MKKIFGSLFLLAVFILAACSPQEDDIFGESSAVRIDATLKADNDILTGAANGWLMQYFPQSSRAYGGYNVLVKFEDGRVTVAGELDDPDATAASLYTLKQSAGPVLSFDEYNDIFHFFSDPSYNIGAGPGKGLEGDFEFLILKATADTVKLKGRKTGNIVIMTPFAKTGSSSWADYIEILQDADATMTFRLFNYLINGKTIPVSVSDRTLTFTYENADGQEISVTVPYIITPTGYQLYEPEEIDGLTVSGFTFDAVTETFSAVEDGNAILVPIIPPLNQTFISGNWFFAYSQMGSWTKLNWDVVKNIYATSPNVAGERLLYAYMGTADGNLAFIFNSSGYTGSLYYNKTLVGDDKITLQFAMAGGGNGVWYHNYAGFANLLNPLGYSSARTFTLTTDNLSFPSWIRLTDDANPNNWMLLSATQVNYPFDN
jgi:hypothetical protein